MLEDYKQKIEKQHKLRKKTIKAVREHFNLEDIDFIEKELLDNMKFKKFEPIKEITVQPEPEKKQEFQPKIKTSIVARSIFKTNFERYEWHIKNGCVNPDDREWFENYIKSDEYKEIYK